MKFRKSQMKLRKNEIVSPKNSTVSRWKMKNPHGGILDSLRGGLHRISDYKLLLPTIRATS